MSASRMPSRQCQAETGYRQPDDEALDAADRAACLPESRLSGTRVLNISCQAEAVHQHHEIGALVAVPDHAERLPGYPSAAAICGNTCLGDGHLKRGAWQGLSSGIMLLMILHFLIMLGIFDVCSNVAAAVHCPTAIPLGDGRVQGFLCM